MTLDPLLKPVRCSLLVRLLAVGPGGLVNVAVALVTQGLKVGPLEADLAALLLGAPALHFDQVVDAAGRDHITLGLTAFTERVGSQLLSSELTPLAAVHQLDVEFTVCHRGLGRS